MHDKDFAILTLQIGYMNESQKRIETMLLEFNSAMGKKIETLETKFEKEKEANLQERNTNLKFRTRVGAYATAGSFIGGGLLQILSLIISK